MNTSPSTTVDQTALRVNQASIVTLLLLAFLLDQIWLVAFVGLVMLVGTVWPRAGLFKLVYSRILRPAGIARPQIEPDAPQPHLFAQGLGGLVLLAAVAALEAGALVTGWLLVGMVILLAAINLFLGFCVGCFIYPLPPELEALVPAGRPALLYFTTDDCIQCRFRQTPILQQLNAQAGVAIHTLDAIQYETAARFFGIMTVPTTVWLNAEHRPVAVNHGLVTLDQLQRQMGAPAAH